MTTHRLRLRLIKQGLKEHKCENCQLTEWQGKPIPLELDHIDGNKEHNELSNLRVLCCNCHAQTETWRGRKLKKPLQSFLCQTCFKRKVSRINLRCKSCAAKSRKHTKIMWPTVEELINRVKVTSFSQTARELGVTDNAIRKHIKNHNNEYKSR